MTNQKGFAIIAIPLTLAILGLIGSSVFANLDHAKGLEGKRDEQRKADMVVLQDKLKTYQAEHKTYPVQKKETVHGQDILAAALKEIPRDPLSGSGLSYGYWSDGQSYNLWYFSEITRQQMVVFGE
ncbi:MAG: type II secretion system protein [Candidatus Komeilibacteria bacterium]|nr:type II secretion system protein [Candidatus Komeilibacteria bacterium]